ncbi:MAG: response regulator [Magnetococcales bacterium]|nr:response regulator [Magnetococcales bacterium]MBF0114321.1 response regulator [Magnetococcales bacterium]
MGVSTAVLIVMIEDEAQIRRFVRMVLEGEHYVVVEAESGRRGLIEVGTRRPDLLVLDLGLPDVDGIELIRDVRSWSKLPILILSARGSEAEKVAALDAGADDYLTKPFGVPELLARVRALLRRAACPSADEPNVVRFGTVEVNLLHRLVTRNGQMVHMTALEYRLLVQLLSNAERVLTHQTLLRDVWGPNHITKQHYLRVYMAHLRHKLEQDPNRPKYFLTESGIGYRLTLQESAGCGG